MLPFHVFAKLAGNPSIWLALVPLAFWSIQQIGLSYALAPESVLSLLGASVKHMKLFKASHIILGFDYDFRQEWRGRDIFSSFLVLKRP